MTELRFEWDPKKALSNFTFLRPRVDPLEIPGNRLKPKFLGRSDSILLIF